MKLSGLHLLLTYQCTLECDHCFVFGSPNARGVMKIAGIREILKEAKKIRSDLAKNYPKHELAKKMTNDQ